MNIFNPGVTGRLCILLFLHLFFVSGCSQFFPPCMSILARARSYLFIYLFFFLFRALVLLSSRCLVSSFYFHFACFTFIFIFEFTVDFFLFCFVSLFFHCLEVAGEMNTERRNILSYIKSRSSSRPPTAM